VGVPYRLPRGSLNTQIPPRAKCRGDISPTIPPRDLRGATVRGKRFLALTAATGTAAAAATGTAAEDASAAGSAAVNDVFRGAGLSHEHTVSPNPL